MVDKLSLSLDDIIKESRKNDPSRRRHVRDGRSTANTHRQGFSGGIHVASNARPIRTRSSPRSRHGSAPYTRREAGRSWRDERDASARGSCETVKLLISNLAGSVYDSDIEELFAEIGPLKSAIVHYDDLSNSLGTAEVVFERKSDALKAMELYDGEPLDGRVMHIEIVTAAMRSSPQQSRMAPTRNQLKSVINYGEPPQSGATSRQPRSVITGSLPRSMGNREQNHAFRGDNRGSKSVHVPPKKCTLEELDAELDNYAKQIMESHVAG